MINDNSVCQSKSCCTFCGQSAAPSATKIAMNQSKNICDKFFEDLIEKSTIISSISIPFHSNRILFVRDTEIRSAGQADPTKEILNACGAYQKHESFITECESYSNCKFCKSNNRNQEILQTLSLGVAKESETNESETELNKKFDSSMKSSCSAFSLKAMNQCKYCELPKTVSTTDANECQSMDECNLCGTSKSQSTLGASECQSMDACKLCGSSKSPSTTVCTTDCKSMDECKYCAGSSKSLSTLGASECQSMDACKLCGSSKSPSTTVCTTDCKSMDECKYCAGSSKSQSTLGASDCQSMEACKFCEQSTSQTTVCTTDCKSMNECKYCAGSSKSLSTVGASECQSMDECKNCGSSKSLSTTEVASVVQSETNFEISFKSLEQKSALTSSRSIPLHSSRVRLGSEAELTHESNKSRGDFVVKFNEKLYCNPSCELLNVCSSCRRPEALINTQELSECKSYNSCKLCAVDSDILIQNLIAGSTKISDVIVQHMSRHEVPQTLGSETRLMNMLRPRTIKVLSEEVKEKPSTIFDSFEGNLKASECRSMNDCKYCGTSKSLLTLGASECPSMDECKHCGPSTSLPTVGTSECQSYDECNLCDQSEAPSVTSAFLCQSEVECKLCEPSASLSTVGASGCPSMNDCKFCGTTKSSSNVEASECPSMDECKYCGTSKSLSTLGASECPSMNKCKHCGPSASLSTVEASECQSEAECKYCGPSKSSSTVEASECPSMNECKYCGTSKSFSTIGASECPSMSECKYCGTSKSFSTIDASKCSSMNKCKHCGPSASLSTVEASECQSEAECKYCGPSKSSSTVEASECPSTDECKYCGTSNSLSTLGASECPSMNKCKHCGPSASLSTVEASKCQSEAECKYCGPSKPSSTVEASECPSMDECKYCGTSKSFSTIDASECPSMNKCKHCGPSASLSTVEASECQSEAECKYCGPSKPSSTVEASECPSMDECKYCGKSKSFSTIDASECPSMNKCKHCGPSASLSTVEASECQSEAECKYCGPSKSSSTVEASECPSMNECKYCGTSKSFSTIGASECSSMSECKHCGPSISISSVEASECQSEAECNLCEPSEAPSVTSASLCQSEAECKLCGPSKSLSTVGSSECQSMDACKNCGSSKSLSTTEVASVVQSETNFEISFKSLEQKSALTSSRSIPLHSSRVRFGSEAKLTHESNKSRGDFVVKFNEKLYCNPSCELLEVFSSCRRPEALIKTHELPKYSTKISDVIVQHMSRHEVPQTLGSETRLLNMLRPRTMKVLSEEVKEKPSAIFNSLKSHSKVSECRSMNDCKYCGQSTSQTTVCTIDCKSMDECKYCGSSMAHASECQTNVIGVSSKMSNIHFTKSFTWSKGSGVTTDCQSMADCHECEGSISSDVKIKSNGLKKSEGSIELHKPKLDGKSSKRPVAKKVSRIVSNICDSPQRQSCEKMSKSPSDLSTKETFLFLKKCGSFKKAKSEVGAKRNSNGIKPREEKFLQFRDESKAMRKSVQGDNNSENERKRRPSVKTKCTVKNEFNSKKYLKMKHEIELKNYLLDKLNRELEEKTLKGRSDIELIWLKQEILKVINILQNMVQFAIFLQRNNRAERWGPIPISPVNPRQIATRPKSCPSTNKKLRLPQTPSGISKVSGFESLEDVMLQGEKEHCFNHVKLEEKEHLVQKCSKEIEELERQLKKLQENSKNLQAKMSERRPVTRC